MGYSSAGGLQAQYILAVTTRMRIELANVIRAHAGSRDIRKFL
jgi:hypothetical protein